MTIETTVYRFPFKLAPNNAQLQAVLDEIDVKTRESENKQVVFSLQRRDLSNGLVSLTLTTHNGFIVKQNKEPDGRITMSWLDSEQGMTNEEQDNLHEWAELLDQLANIIVQSQ